MNFFVTGAGYFTIFGAGFITGVIVAVIVGGILVSKRLGRL